MIESIPALAGLTDRQLFLLRAALDKEMDSRNLSSGVGRLGEDVAIEYFNTTAGLPTLLAAPPGTKNVDAISRDGERYSIKTILKAKKTGTIYPDSKDPDRPLFEYLLIVRLRSNYSLEAIFRFDWDLFTKVRSWDMRMRAWYIGCSKRRLARAEQILQAN